MEKKWMILEQFNNDIIDGWITWLHSEGNKGHRARLRRCTTIEEVMIQIPFNILYNKLTRNSDFPLEGLALVAGLLVWCENNSTHKLSSLLGKKKDGSEQPVFSESRFRRLLGSSNPNEFLTLTRRAIQQVNRTCCRPALANDILHWSLQRQNPEDYKGIKQWQFCQANLYFTELFKYNKT